MSQGRWPDAINLGEWRTACGLRVHLGIIGIAIEPFAATKMMSVWGPRLS